MKLIKYIAFYGISNNREGALSAKNKIDYICSKLVEENYTVEIISPSWTKNDSGIYKGEKQYINKNILLKTFMTFGSKYRSIRKCKYIFSLLQLFIYLCIYLKKNEQIIVYHSIILYYPLKLLKKVKKINIVLEVEEVYSDIQILPKSIQKMENKLFNIADKYIFSTELLNEKINISKKPYVIIYGTYNIEKIYYEKFNDNRIHLVYAGTLDLQKRGAETAVLVGKYLDNNYHIHILGFGKENEKKYIENLIQELSIQTECKITYEGSLSGLEYIKFLQKCDIGLSTQNPEGIYNESSFPSKILSYISNGLRVVSIKIKVLEISKIKKLIYFYEKNNSEEIARKINQIDFHDKYDARKIIKELDKKFKEDIKKLLD